jgi:ribosome maturation factor RimP
MEWEEWRCGSIRGSTVKETVKEFVVAFVEKNDPLWVTLQEIVSDEGLLLYDIERFGSGQVRVFVTKEGSVEGAATSDQAQGGVTSGDCSRVCRRLMVFFAAKGPDFGLVTEPELDVSSPGINRVLRLPEHFQGVIGERVKVISRPGAGDSGRSVVGVVCSFDGTTVRLKEEGSGVEVAFPLGEVKRASVEFSFGSVRPGAH